MAMKSKDRYQSVADLEQDLKKIILQLPATQQKATGSRSVDPHSTQPDLPMLYEAIQAAKEKAANQDSGVQTPPPRQSPPAGPQHCPRCSTVVNPQATYCPRCGSTLTPQNVQKSGPNSIIPKQDIGEQTMIIKPQAMGQQMADYSPKAMIQGGNSGSRPPYVVQQNMGQVAADGKMGMHSSTAIQTPPRSPHIALL
jgi:hypothetical protein